MKADEFATFLSPIYGELIASGIIVTDWINKHDVLMGSYTIQTISVEKISLTVQNADQTWCLFEWIGNIYRNYSWPDLFKSDSFESYNAQIGGEDDHIIVNFTNNSYSSGRSCLAIHTDSVKLFLVVNDRKDENSRLKDGYIIYREDPGEDKRQKIRDSLSFALGAPLDYFGYTSFSQRWQQVKIYAVSLYQIRGPAYSPYSFPPAPIFGVYEPMIDTNKISKMVDSIYRIYDEIGMKEIIWAYWHARVAPVHFAAAQYGALLEMVQTKYFKYKNLDIKTDLVDKDDWKKFSASVSTSIDNSTFDEDVKKILRNRLSNMNSLPQPKLFSQMCKHLGIEFGPVEQKAWQQRNISAHGVIPGSDQFTKLLNNNKILMTFFHRLIIKITEGSSYYNDYSSLHFPIRNTDDNLPSL